MRSLSARENIVEHDPFPGEAARERGHPLLTAVRSTPSRVAWELLKTSVVGRERSAAGERYAYLVYPDGIGRSKLTASLIERELGTRSTRRNRNAEDVLLGGLRDLDGVAGSALWDRSQRR